MQRNQVKKVNMVSHDDVEYDERYKKKTNIENRFQMEIY